ncbi:MAG: hypothetical protein ACKVUT_15500 [Gaiella sp.]
MSPHDTTYRLLVIANETITGSTLHGSIARCTAGRQSEVLLVAPALNRRLRHWLSDDREARRGATRRLVDGLAALRGLGVDAEGVVGDADPLLAIGDALAVFAADEILVATHPEGRSYWLERDLVWKAAERFPQPVWHVTVAPEELRGTTVRGAEFAAAA